VLPRRIVSHWLSRDPLFDMVPSDVGYYPTAQWHYVDRPKGSQQLILIYCISGEGWVETDNEKLKIEPGQMLIMPPNHPHKYGAHPEWPWTIYWMHLSGSKVKSLLRQLEINASSPILYPGHDPALPPLFERVLHLLSQDYSDENLRASSTSAHQLAVHLISIRHRQPNGEDSHSQKIKYVIDIMNQTLNQRFTLEELASQANMSKSHFASVFKKRTGFSPLDYHMRLKMQKACFLLDSTSLSVKEIGAQLGFEDSLYFSRRFRSVHSCSPIQYKMIQKG
jgi:AraC-like DNA-binding protein